MGSPTRDDQQEDEVPEMKRKHTGKQPPRKAEGREVAYSEAEVEDYGKLPDCIWHAEFWFSF